MLDLLISNFATRFYSDNLFILAGLVFNLLIGFSFMFKASISTHAALKVRSYLFVVGVLVVALPFVLSTSMYGVVNL